MEIAAERAKRADRLLGTIRGDRDHVKGGADIKAGGVGVNGGERS